MLGVRARTADPLPRAPHVVHNPEGVCDVAGAALAVSARLCTAMHSRPRVPRLPVWDTPGFTKKLTSEQKAMKRLSEIKNGRLAMIGMVRPRRVVLCCAALCRACSPRSDAASRAH